MCSVSAPDAPHVGTTTSGGAPNSTPDINPHKSRRDLEYGEAIVELHDDAIQPGEKILLVDDLLATGGTAEAGIKLLERLGGEIISCAFVIDLPDLGGRAKLEAMGMEVTALCTFDGE